MAEGLQVYRGCAVSVDPVSIGARLTPRFLREFGAVAQGARWVKPLV